MDLISIAVALAQFAPSLLRVFGVGEKSVTVAEKVIDIAKNVTGAKSPEEALNAIKADMAAQFEFNEKVMEADAELTKAYLADVQSARAMQVAALAQEDVFSKRFVYYFAAVWSVFAMVYFGAVTFIPVPASGQRVSDTILGVMISTVMGGIFGYFYGSTKSSALKTQLIAQQK